jgi:protoheme IX farnesyltransferase
MSEHVERLPAQASSESESSAGITWRQYLELTKPTVVALMILTSLIGMLLATPGVPGWEVLLYGNLGIAL